MIRPGRFGDRQKFCVYYQEIQRELKRILIYECRCNEGLKAKAEGSTHLAYTVRKLSADDETLRREISLRTHAFFQKPLPVVFPEHVTREEREGEGGVVSQVVVEEHRTSCGIDGAKFSSHIRGLGIR